jgi:O-acetyl-ADP-ribose deacetylase (regulator of RNase III)
VWRGGGRGEPALLASCHRRSLEVAGGLGCRTVSFPAISTGVYGYPVDQAAEVAVTSVRAALRDAPDIELVRFVLFGEKARDAFAAALTGA